MNCRFFSFKNIVINHFSFPIDKEDEGNRQRVADFETTMEHAGIFWNTHQTIKNSRLQ